MLDDHPIYYGNSHFFDISYLSLFASQPGILNISMDSMAYNQFNKLFKYIHNLSESSDINHIITTSTAAH